MVNNVPLLKKKDIYVLFLPEVVNHTTLNFD